MGKIKSKIKYNRKRRNIKGVKTSELYINGVFAVGMWVFIYLKDFLGYVYVDRVVGVVGMVLGIVSLYVTLRIKEEQDEYTYRQDKPRFDITYRRRNTDFGEGKLEDLIKEIKGLGGGLRIENKGVTSTENLEVSFYSKIEYDKLGLYVDKVNNMGLGVNIKKVGGCMYELLYGENVKEKVEINKESLARKYYTTGNNINGDFEVDIPTEVIDNMILKDIVMLKNTLDVVYNYKRGKSLEKEYINLKKDMDRFKEQLDMGCTYIHENREYVDNKLQSLYNKNGILEDKSQGILRDREGYIEIVEIRRREIVEVLGEYADVVKNYICIGYIGADGRHKLDILRIHLVPQIKEDVYGNYILNIHVYTSVESEHLGYREGELYIEDNILKQEEI